MRESEEAVSEALDAMEKALDNAGRLARNLGEVGALGIEEPGTLDVNELVRASIRGIPEKSVETALDAFVAPVFARASDVSRALRALLQNAREANGGTGRVRIATGEDSDEVRVLVEDGGEGIPEVVRRRDFDPLFSTSGQRGRGLGITVARLAALIAGGRLTLEDLQGGGTRAIFALPRGAPR
ncbi:MAG TPA: ATP-binding protein [Thermoanaerobaculia bacterium]